MYDESKIIEIESFEDKYGCSKIIDEYCDKMNIVRNTLLKKTSLAKMDEIVASSKEKPIIGTLALDTCYGILFYDREHKEGICGHAVPSYLVNLLDKMIKLLGTEKRTIEYLIVPGFRNEERKDFRGLEELENVLFNRTSQNIQLVPLINNRCSIKLHQRTLSYEFAFDTITGEFVTEYAFFDEREHNPRYIPSKKYFGK